MLSEGGGQKTRQLKNGLELRDGGMAQVVERLSCKSEALSSNSNTVTKKS
jgi:hypothetical protein